ncbi:MAG: 30S ribosomal protein S9 [Candidatus Pacebacteria bacterium]|jgi:small subunit ribosomal protein S9|nr:30S ribosomal protein S9 [Candidatus Paceibacterota bacterium]MDD3048299.1 30S ribosomal protein S9 [Candidatus Paceibacterota bacterium]MDD3510185.1 30S ribosomal protein S9 [Candidatus Paceibacterota bacterium]MDD3918613.1 30S ribosomal protein S9 [Candidatus Paceibacterota bacterium]MDD4664871.1 30S ribosomal protein S9 [Candidatus Paceibacterota bacterium]
MVKESKTTKKQVKYISTVGKRKTAVARIRLFQKGKNKITVNEKDYKDYFQTEDMQGKVREPIDKMKITDKFDISILVKGGGLDAQAEATAHGIARALVKLDEEAYRKRLRKEELLTRDSRKKERKKPGLKRARKAPRWSKR